MLPVNLETPIVTVAHCTAPKYSMQVSFDMVILLLFENIRLNVSNLNHGSHKKPYEHKCLLKVQMAAAKPQETLNSRRLTKSSTIFLGPNPNILYFGAATW